MIARPWRDALSIVVALAIALLGVSAAGAQASALYFPLTGHRLTDDQGFLSFWRAHDGERLLGFPISEAAQIDGVPTQYFERGRLEQRLDPAGAAVVATGAVGREYADALWKSFALAPAHKPLDGERVFDNGHTLREPFLGFWEAAGGMEFFGAPISEAAWELTSSGRQQVQYFERARLERDPQSASADDQVRVSGLGSALAALRGVDTARVDNIGYESFGPPAPALPAAPDAAPPARPPAAPAPAAPAPPVPAAAQPAARAEIQAPSGAGKRIVVNLSDQWLYAFDGDEQVFDAPVSTGRNGMETPTGSYAIYTKLKVQTMDGITNGEYWVVPNVPNVMYINGGVALHGTYWHNRFGTGARLSHGCVNLPLDAASWLFRWAPVGTPVQVTY